MGEAICPVALNPDTFCYHGVFSTRDQKKYFQFPFEVKHGASKVSVRLLYSKEQKNTLYLQAYDYRRFRGIGKPAKNDKKSEIEMTITPTYASPGALFGNLPKGRWVAEIDAMEVSSICKYQLIIEVFYDSAKANRFAIKKPNQKNLILSKEKRWYKGELHIHSQESDGADSVKDIIQLAKKEKLDFIAITDHNTNSAWQYYKKNKDILLLPAVEISTYKGHANALGVEDWIDWRLGNRNRSLQDIVKDAQGQGGIFSINHPRTFNHNGEASWRFQDTNFHEIDAIEIWNAPWHVENKQANERARSLWNELLNKGYRLTGIGGSDLHCFDEYKKKLGYFLNYIYCENLSQEALLEGIRRGKVFMTLGPKLFFKALYAGKEYMMGDSIPAIKGTTIEFHIEIKDLNEALELHILKDGYPIKKHSCPSNEKMDLFFEKIIDEKTWYRIELHQKIHNDEEDSLIAIANPIFIQTTLDE